MRAELEAALPGAVFAGHQEGEALARWYASADVFVFPSTTETLGNVVLESLASGVPAVVMDRGGPQDLIEPGETGYVVPGNRPAELADAVERLLRDARAARAPGRPPRAADRPGARLGGDQRRAAAQLRGGGGGAIASMKILDLTQSYAATGGGVRTYVHARRDYLRRRGEGDRHVLVVPGGEDTVAREEGEVTYTVASPRVPGSRVYRLLLRSRRVREILRAEAARRGGDALPVQPAVGGAEVRGRAARRARRRDLMTACRGRRGARGGAGAGAAGRGGGGAAGGALRARPLRPHGRGGRHLARARGAAGGAGRARRALHPARGGPGDLPPGAARPRAARPAGGGGGGAAGGVRGAAGQRRSGRRWCWRPSSGSRRSWARTW